MNTTKTEQSAEKTEVQTRTEPHTKTEEPTRTEPHTKTEEKTRTELPQNSSRPSNGNSTQISSGSQSDGPSIHLSTWQEPSQWEDSQEVLEPGVSIIGKYRLEKIVGTGGMGEVWKAVDLIQEAAKLPNPHVAIKFLSPDFKQHPDALKVLVYEFSRYKKLGHKNIVQATELNRTGRTVFIVMEFLSGIPLKQHIMAHPNGLAIEKAEPIIRGMANALSHAHNEGIAHLDFKPGNVFYDADQKMVKVIDFGIARAISVKSEPLVEGQETKRMYEELRGLTKAYASYEMFLGLEPEPRDDIYALACVTYELLVGKHPFDKMMATEAEDKKLSPKPIKGLKRRQNKALLRALAFKRKERTPTAEQFLAELFPKKTPAWQWPLIAVLGIIVVGIIAFFTLLPDPAICKQQLEAGKCEAAHACYQKVLDLDKTNAEALAGLKEIEACKLLPECKQHLEAGKCEAAQDCYQEVLGLDPKNAEALADLKKIEACKLLPECKKHLEMGKWEAARACYQEVLKLDPKNPDAMARLAEISASGGGLKPLEICQQHLDAGSLTQGNEGTALACYKEVLASDTSNPEALKGLLAIKARYLRGIDTASMHEQSQMEQHLTQEFAPVEQALDHEATVLLKECRAHQGANNKKKACPCYENVLKLDDDNDFALDGLKWGCACGEDRLPQCKTHFEADRLTTPTGKNALDCYLEVLEKCPGNANAKVLDGLNAIAKRYEEWANKALRKRQFNKVKKYLASLKTVESKLEKADSQSAFLAGLKQIIADLKWRLKKAQRKAAADKQAAREPAWESP